MRKVPHLPEEIVEEILLRLQVIDLLRCKTVCKLWYRLIYSAHFIRRHLADSKALPSRHRILSPYCESSPKSIDCSDLFGGEVVTYDLPPPCEFDAVIFLGACDGLVSLYDYWSRTICVWNPATRMGIILRTLELGNDGVTFYWFGRESEDDGEYRLLYGRSSRKNLIHLVSPFAADGDEDGWNSALELPNLYLQIGAGTLLNRRVHWPAVHFAGEDIGGFVIVAFDLRSRTSFEIPGHPGTVILEFATLCAIDGRLCAIHRTTVENKPIFELWTMKEYGVKESWTKTARILSDIDVRPCPKGQYPFLGVVKVTDEGELIIEVEATELMVYNIAEGKSRKLMRNRRARGAMYVVESLCFP